ncbi:MAG: bifunctional tRNA (5-methylaminomethyl-2-thiouridine)(34)-methyltransferase MnmD/FAD-dependent 5-carboxymethylaminomethyl-2-thiouridine(34) oxidoreductase MnmC [Proteobacteria bacterium]|nr:bifunctional tRNA (5-methylaminomethyl-2-thiouridine)(34)-methyltransferase MnmD/FAD-dependent 5-carboxymethylaminomethyl-2-thiouridine(34) oxidoreductase MnmC [Pseudomonadota bacterium]
MKSIPIVAAELARDDRGVPYSSEYGDVYHPHAGALQQARHVFLAGNDLPERWAGRARFVILETGFGLGNNFLATWQAWRGDPRRCERLVFLSIEQRPLRRGDLASIARPRELQSLAERLAERWPPLVPGLHRLAFDDGQVELLLAFGDIEAWLPELVASVDAYYLDGFAPARNPRMWSERVCKALGRLAAPGATLATWSAARAVREALTTAGFEVRSAPGAGGKRDITLAEHRPRHQAARPAARTPAGTERRAVVVGGGLAGCAAAWALAAHGWQTEVIDRHAQPAMEASGNWAGLFHGTVHGEDGTHARFNRAAALAAADTIAAGIAAGHLRGSAGGLLRMEHSLDADAMRNVLDHQRLPSDYVQALDARDASTVAGLRLDRPAWLYTRGGWAEPAALARHLLDLAGPRAAWRAEQPVSGLQRRGGEWQLLAADGRVIAAAPVVVLANANAAGRWLAEAGWPVVPVRGQLSRIRVGATAAPRLPLAGAGYVLPPIDGWLCFGATSQAGDMDPSVRAADHATNLSQLSRLIGDVPTDASWEGRTAWRAVSADRLPVIGAAIDAAALDGMRLDQPRHLPRLPGLYVHAALGSRGLNWCMLDARLLAAVISGAPAPLEASLIDAVDPGRFVSRRHNRRSVPD